MDISLSLEKNGFKSHANVIACNSANGESKTGLN